jgi:hypothetical protein
MKMAIPVLSYFLAFILCLLFAVKTFAQQVAPAPPKFRPAEIPLKTKQLSPAQQAISAAILHQVPIPQVAQAVMPDPPSSLDHAHWTAPVGIHYGATFDFSSQPYNGTIQEAYQFVEPDQESAFKVLAYCEENSSTSGNKLADFCPPIEFTGSEIRLQYPGSLAPPYSVAHGYLYEDFVLNAKPIWILVAEGDKQPQWRFLNYVDNMEDSFHTPNNARMSTLFLPSNTLIALDQGQREVSPDMDIYDYPGQFLYESLTPRTTVITRVNPEVPAFMRWGVQRFVSVGVSGLVWQWLLLALTPLTPIVVVGWIWHRLRGRNTVRE